MMTDSSIRITRSVVAAEALLPLLSAAYELPAPLRCVLVSVGDNDNYLVQAGDFRAALRIYRYGKYWLPRESDYRFELDWLTFLRGRGLPVSAPIARRDGDLLGTLDAPEGRRYWALFTFAPGRTVRPMSREQSRQFGEAVAGIHLASNDFVSAHERTRIDLEFLLDRPVDRVRRFLDGRRPEDVRFIADVAEELKQQIPELGIAGDGFGVIGGDFHGGNNHLSDTGELTMFDFDLCGHGWRAFDVAVFVWGTGEEHRETIDGFMEGYEAVRPLAEAERRAIPLFVLARQIWIMGSHTTYIETGGMNWLGDGYRDRMVGFLRREWEKSKAG
jgi:Ser/Thr protein kinase RdoA (MazF antagonist)